MNPFYVKLLKTRLVPALLLLLLAKGETYAQACSTAQGDQTTYGTNNVWIGYVYTSATNASFSNYMGYVNEGSASSPNFDESFGGSTVTYNTSGCSITTDHFAVRYKLIQTLNGNYTFTIGGDDGVRLSLDGGNTWTINLWGDQSYTTNTVTLNLSGTYNVVLEYYENAGANRVTYNMVKNCIASGDQTITGTNNVWIGYLYQGMNFDTYKGTVTEGTSGNPNFDENFGNTSNTTIAYNTSTCSINTYQFSARYRLQKTLTYASYVITIGGDDGYRFSLDGGNTWVINKWGDQGYVTTTYTAPLSGTYNMVLEYYQNGGADRVSFSMSSSTLPVTLTSWNATVQSNQDVSLKWTAENTVKFNHYIIQRSTDGLVYTDIHTTPAENTANTQSYAYTDVPGTDGQFYYRLEMVDIDGTTTYSNVLSLSLSTAKTIRLYPTVVENGMLYVEPVSPVQNATLELFDTNGRRLQTKEWASLDGRQSVNLAGGSRLPAGAYIVRLTNGQQLLAKQIIIVK